VTIHTHQGDEAVIKLPGITRLFGKMSSGRILFVRLVEKDGYRVRSIRILAGSDQLVRPNPTPRVQAPFSSLPIPAKPLFSSLRVNADNEPYGTKQVRDILGVGYGRESHFTITLFVGH
jgi:hypothetical protein